MNEQPDSLDEIINSLITRETHKGAVNRVRIQARAAITAVIDKEKIEAYKKGYTDASIAAVFVAEIKGGKDDTAR